MATKWSQVVVVMMTVGLVSKAWHSLLGMLGAILTATS